MDSEEQVVVLVDQDLQSSPMPLQYAQGTWKAQPTPHGLGGKEGIEHPG